MTDSEISVLVVGAGSIGQRHIRNLVSLGIHRISVVDPLSERRVAAEAAGASACASLEEGLAAQPTLVLVCTPPAQHLATACAALKAGAHVFVEKPLATSLDGVDHLLELAARAQRIVAVGYNLRFHPGLQLYHSLVRDGRLGQILAIRAEFGQFLPDWRPGQDYRQGYHARGPGAGIIFDASHELDYVRWLGGEVTRVFCTAEHVSSLETEAEDVAALTLRLATGAIAEVHLDCVQRGYSRTCKVIGDKGTAIWDYQRGIRLLTAEAGQWQKIPCTPDPNDMYLAEMRHLLACMRGEDLVAVDGATGKRVLQVALAAKESAATGQEISV